MGPINFICHLAMLLSQKLWGDNADLGLLSLTGLSWLPSVPACGHLSLAHILVVRVMTTHNSSGINMKGNRKVSSGINMKGRKISSIYSTTNLVTARENMR